MKANARFSLLAIFKSSPLTSDVVDLLSTPQMELLEHALRSFSRLLPHTDTSSWIVKRNRSLSHAKWTNDFSSISLNVTLNLGGDVFSLKAVLRRRKASRGIKVPSIKPDVGELNLCTQIVERISEVFGSNASGLSEDSVRAILSLFDEQIVASHVKNNNFIELDLGRLFTVLRSLSEQSYENKSMTYGIIVQAEQKSSKPKLVFPFDFIEKKRYRALSDGFRTAFEVSNSGALLGLVDLLSQKSQGGDEPFYPEWSQYLCFASHGSAISVGLTRQGDILVFIRGTLRFTYRSGRWQYWNHALALDVLIGRASRQHSNPEDLHDTLKQMYRIAMDVSFRRSGCLLVLLHNRPHLHELVEKGDAIGDPDREKIYHSFDKTINAATLMTLSRSTVAELAGLDGAIVVDSRGSLLAYGAVLITREESGASEGSRTKAAISASRFGIAVKVSSDGDIAFYDKGKIFMQL